MSEESLRFVRPSVLAMDGYTPGEQMLDCVKLNTNEPAWPSSPAVARALSEFGSAHANPGTGSVDSLRRYPSPLADALRAQAAAVFGVGADMVVAGNGSDDLLTVLVRTFVGENETLAVPSPTYGLYDTLAAIQGSRIVHLPYGPNWELPEGLAKQGAKLVFIASPNNPSATLARREAVLATLRERSCVVVVDEAYADFAPESPSFISDLGEHPNLIVIRTFSKSYALAGARLGLLFASPALVRELNKVKDSYNVNAVTQAMGVAALADQPYVKALVERTLEERRFLEHELAALGYRWPTSDANFLLVDVGSRARAQAIYTGLKERRILVRYWDKPRLAESVRITVGTREQNELVLDAIRTVVRG